MKCDMCGGGGRFHGPGCPETPDDSAEPEVDAPEDDEPGDGGEEKQVLDAVKLNERARNT